MPHDLHNGNLSVVDNPVACITTKNNADSHRECYYCCGYSLNDLYDHDRGSAGVDSGDGDYDDDDDDDDDGDGDDVDDFDDGDDGDDDDDDGDDDDDDGDDDDDDDDDDHGDGDYHQDFVLGAPHFVAVLAS